MTYRIIVIGTSTGGFKALQAVLSPLPADFGIPIAVVRHQQATADDIIVRLLDRACHLKVKFAESKEKIRPGTVYLAPPDRHLLFEDDRTFSLSRGARVNYSRPAIDVLFGSAADAYGSAVIGIVLTGANNDGAEGLHRIRERSGLTIVQDPKTAESRAMPEAAIAATHVAHIIRLDQIGPFLWDLQRKGRKKDI